MRGNGAEPRPLRHRGRFRNPWPGSDSAGFVAFLRWQLGRRLAQELRRGAREDPRPPAGTPHFERPHAPRGTITATWIGHATVLLQLGGQNVLTDPMWGERASPIRFAGPRRKVRPGVELEALPPIDIVLVSHNHYDHLDDGSVRRLAAHSPEARWLVPLGLGEFVSERGAARVHEASWWQRVAWGDVRAHATPAQHFSARGLADRNRSLWCGWSLDIGGRRVFFAGDSAYHPVFPLIGERYGPFELALIPIGAYEPRWFMRTAHMDPEESVRTYVDIGARGAMLPIHWGTFRLTDEPLDEPRERIVAAWAAAGLPAGDLRIIDHGATLRL